MNTIPMLRHAVVALMLSLAVGAPPAPLHAAPQAAPPVPLVHGVQRASPVHARSPVLFGGFLQDVVSNRTRLIQMSFVAVLVGVLILYKK